MLVQHWQANSKNCTSTVASANQIAAWSYAITVQIRQIIDRVSADLRRITDKSHEKECNQ